MGLATKANGGMESNYRQYSGIKLKQKLQNKTYLFQKNNYSEDLKMCLCFAYFPASFF